jgi:hypothetical protein
MGWVKVATNVAKIGDYATQILLEIWQRRWMIVGARWTCKQAEYQNLVYRAFMVFGCRLVTM